jgi:hypothetical protein
MFEDCVKSMKLVLQASPIGLVPSALTATIVLSVSGDITRKQMGLYFPHDQKTGSSSSPLPEKTESHEGF